MKLVRLHSEQQGRAASPQAACQSGVKVGYQGKPDCSLLGCAFAFLWHASEILRGKDKGIRTGETVSYVCTIDPDPGRGEELLERIRGYWGIEGGLHQRLDVSCGEDSSRVRNRNALLVLGMVRRAALGHLPALAQTL